MTESQENMDAVTSNPGVFELPTPESLELRQHADALRGAERTTWDESDESGQEFPMIVWLRGDEPWFTQFDMDADAVMAALGIKRSRLTQISGRDLRVGRVRMDRYIRPVYRSLDVEQYLKWTRATASHQKSSDAIKIAVDQLQEQSNRIQSTLDSISHAFTESIKHEMSSFIAETVSQGLAPMEEGLVSFRDTVLDMAAQMNSRIVESSEIMRTASESMQSTLQETARQQAAALELMTLQLNQTSEKTAVMEERLTAWDNLLTENLRAIASDLELLKKPARFEKAVSRKAFKTRSAAPSAAKPKIALRAAPGRRKPK